MSAAQVPAPAGRSAVTRVVFEAPDIEPVRSLLLEEADRRGLSIEEAGPTLYVETFLDTRDRRVHRAGTYLVHRDLLGASEIGWGSLREAGGPGDVLPYGNSVSLAARAPRIPDDCPEPLRGALQALAGRRPFRPALQLDVRREELVVKRQGGWLGTVVLTRAVATPESPVASVRLARVDVRAAMGVTGEMDSIFEAVRRRAGLRAVTSSTIEAAMLAAAVTPSDRLPLGPMDVYLGITSGELAFAVMRRQLQEIVRREPGTRLGLDPEELHKLRVAVRRLRAALRLWRWALGPFARELQRRWRRLGRALGECRDLDVERGHLRAWSAGLPPEDRAAFAPIEDWIEARRDEARAKVLCALDARGQERLARTTSRWLREGRALPIAGRRPAHRELGRLAHERYRSLRKAGRRIGAASPPEDLHRVRILAKHLRYCLEFHAELLGPDGRRMIRSLVDLQDLLGELQDVRVSLDRLRPLGQDGFAPLPAATLGLLERLRADRESRGRELRDGFPAVFEEVSGAAWQRLKSELGASA